MDALFRHVKGCLSWKLVYDHAQEEDFEERKKHQCPPPIRGGYTFSQFEPKNTLAVPCECDTIDDCRCLHFTCKENNLFRYHTHQKCTFPPHVQFEKNGYFWTERPVWKYHCRRTVNEDMANKIEEICNICNFKCVCTSFKTCVLCDHIVDLKVTDDPIDTFMDLFENLSVYSTY